MSEPDKSVWIRCRPYIESALPYTRGTHTIEDIEDGIESGQFTFWAGYKSAAVTEILHYPRLKAMNVFLYGGDLGELQTLLVPAFERYAKENACKRLGTACRPGLERIMAKHGYKSGWRVIYKDF